MDLPLISAAAASLVALLVGAPSGPSDLDAMNAPGRGPGDLVGATVWGSADPVARWGDVPLASDLALDDLGRVARVVAGPDGEPVALVVAVGGLWGMGAREVEVGMARVHLLQDGAGGLPALVADLSAGGGAPPADGLDL